VERIMKCKYNKKFAPQEYIYYNDVAGVIIKQRTGHRTLYNPRTYFISSITSRSSSL